MPHPLKCGYCSYEVGTLKNKVPQVNLMYWFSDQTYKKSCDRKMKIENGVAHSPLELAPV